MKEIFKDFIFYTDMENIEKLNYNIQKWFSIAKDEIKDENIEKIQFGNFKFGIYFSKNRKNEKNILILKNKKKIKCGNYFINGENKEFYSDSYFLIFHENEKDKSIIFEELMENILKIIKIKNIN